jgi:hypothetical protein
MPTKVRATATLREVQHMHSPHLTLTVAQQQIADLHRAADHQRLAHATINARAQHADAPVAFVRQLRRRLARPQPTSR